MIVLTTKKIQMKILNTDNNILGTEMREPLKATISDAFDRYSEHITRIEVKFDENSDRDSENDKRCVLKRDLKDCNLVVTGADTVESGS
jgi:hypothetical protein